MAKKIHSLPAVIPADGVGKDKKKKDKKRRREKDAGVLETTVKGGDEDIRSPSGGSRSSSSKAAVLRHAPKDSVSPILVSFSNQIVPMDVESLQFAVHEADDEDHKGERVVIGEGSRMDYWGLNFNAGSESQDLCRYMVGVEDKGTGEITLHEAGHAYALQQSVVGREDSVEDHAMQGLDWKQRRDALVNQFGSKKKQAAIRARDANVIEANAVVGGGALSRVLGRALREIDGDDKTTTTEAGSGITDGAATSVEEARRRFLPPVKLDAPTPEGVYSVKDIAGAQELHALGRQIDSSAKECEGGLQQWAKEFAEKPRDSCPHFVSRRISLLPELKNPNQRRRLLQLLYLRHMCKFHLARDLLKGTPSELSTSLDIPEVILRRLLEKFTVPDSAGHKGSKAYHRSKTLKGQLLVHTLCLALVLDGCRVEFGVLSQDLKISETETRALFRELGCKTDKTVAQLKLPLVFPRSRHARKS